MELKLFESRHEVGVEAGQQIDQGLASLGGDAHGLAVAVNEHSARKGIHGATRLVCTDQYGRDRPRPPRQESCPLGLTHPPGA